MNLTVGIVYMDLCMFTSPTTVQKQSSEINKQVQRLLVSNQGLLRQKDELKNKLVGMQGEWFLY